MVGWESSMSAVIPDRRAAENEKSQIGWISWP